MQRQQQQEQLIADIEKIRAAGGVETEAGREMLSELSGKYTPDMFRLSTGTMPPLDPTQYHPPTIRQSPQGLSRTYAPISPTDRLAEQFLGGGGTLGGLLGPQGQTPGPMPPSSMTVGTGGVNITYKKPELSAGERQRKQGLEALRDSANEVRRIYKEYGGQGFTGPIDSILGEFRQRTGVGLKTITRPDGSRYAPEVAFRLHTKGFVKKMYTDSGKQLSDREMAILFETFPRLNMSDAAFETALDVWLESIVQDIAAYQRTGKSPLLSGAQQPQSADPLGLY
jgi:hypothetical protein